jgi:hypothetical protein
MENISSIKQMNLMLWVDRISWIFKTSDLIMSALTVLSHSSSLLFLYIVNVMSDYISGHESLSLPSVFHWEG